jgi:diguanylate cyclase (GGDEF)-like protein
MSTQDNKSLRIFVALISAAGLIYLIRLTPQGLAAAREAPREFFVLAIFVILGEVFSIKVHRRQTIVEEITTSTTFAFALVLGLGTGAGVLAQGLASISADSFRRKGYIKVLFNLSQYVLSLGAAGEVMHLLHHSSLGDRGFGISELGAMAAGATTFFLVNSLLTNTAVALSEGLPLIPNLHKDWASQAFSDTILLGLSPVVVVLAERNLLLVPLIVLPMAAVTKSAQETVKNLALVEEVERRAKENEYQALHDSLTGLPNRKLFGDRLDHAIRMARRRGTRIGVMLMDLDRFKEINDTLGHHNGDAALQQVAHRVGETLRESDTVARLGGDEFAILLDDVADTTAAITAAERVLDVFTQPFSIADLALDLGVSVGITLYPRDGEDAGALVQKADVAMYAAKARHLGFCLYESTLDHYTPERLTRLRELREALTRDELVVFYQPKLDLTSGEVTAAEALVRWNHPRLGMLPPAEFVPLAENTGLIHPLTMHVLNVSLRQAQRWQAAGLKVAVAVNLSAHDLADVEFPNDVRKLLDRWEVDSSMLELEITESTMMSDPARALAVLSRLSDMGIKLAIDDFGTGYSSLAYLRQLPVHAIKIDRSFVMGMPNHSDEVIVRSTIDLARNLSLSVVAEGVEDAEVLSWLAHRGCEAAQGYFVSRPLAPNAFEDWLTKRALDPQPV